MPSNDSSFTAAMISYHLADCPVGSADTKHIIESNAARRRDFLIALSADWARGPGQQVLTSVWK